MRRHLPFPQQQDRAIVRPKDAPALVEGMGYDEACQGLRDRGFVEAWSVRSLSTDSYKYGDGSRSDAAVRGVWYHPAGVVVLTQSHRDRLSTLRLHAQVELPAGRDAYFRGYRGIQGGGSVESLLDGRLALMREVSLGGRGSDEALDEWLRKAQTYGRFLPFDQWRYESVAALPLLRDPHHWLNLDVRPDLEGLDRDAVRAHLAPEVAAAQADILPRLPDSVQRVMLHHDGATRPSWLRMEDALNAVSANAAAQGQRWLSEATRDLVRHWVQVGLGERGEDVAAWRAEDTLPEGTHLPMMLLMGNQVPENQARLMAVLHHASPAILRQWCTVPDACGFTLPLRIVQRSLMGPAGQQADPAPFLDLMQILVDRTGRSTVEHGLLTERWSVLGLLSDPRVVDAGNGRRIDRFAAVVAWLDEHQLPWHQQVRWVDADPRGMTVRTKPAQVHRWQGMAAKEALMQVVGTLHAPLLQPVLAQWEQYLLQEALPESAPVRRRGARL